MLYEIRRGSLGLALTLSFACSGEERSIVADRDAGSAAPVDARVVADAGAPVPDAGSLDATPAVPDAGPPPAPPACDAPAVQSACGDPAIIRVLARLGDHLEPMQGLLQVRLNHYRLGSGELGGVPHNGVTSAGVVDMTARTWSQIHFDMCTGGEMWSEDNCEYNLFAYLDLNEDGELNRGEPAARKIIDVSCFAEPGCHDMVLDCLDGAACITFEADPVCACHTPTCPEQIGKIVTCQ